MLLAMNRKVTKSLQKTACLVAVMAVVTGSCHANAQTPATGAEPSTSAAPVQPPSILATFDEKVDTKSVKAGGAVTAKIAKELKLGDLDIPKGSKLIGTVTSVKSTKEMNGDSLMGVRFDRIEMKGNRELRIRGLIVAIGPAPSNETGLGYNSVLSRGGVGSTPELDPSIGADKYNKDQPPLTKGSTLEGVALGVNFDPDGATLLRGVHRNITLNSNVMIRVALFRDR